eukprot:567879_1
MFQLCKRYTFIFSIFYFFFFCLFDVCKIYMATVTFRTYSGTKRPSCDNDDNCIPIKRRRVLDSYTFDSIAPDIQTPLKFESIDLNHTSKQTYIKTGLQKLSEFWRKMIGSTDPKPLPAAKPNIEHKGNKTPSYIDFDNGTDHFDFQSLLQSLADLDKEQETEEFHYLANQISQLNINLSAQQMQEIIDEEEEMKSMIQDMKALNLNVNTDDQYNEEMIVVLQRLSELTFDCDADYKEDILQRDKRIVDTV